MTPYETAREAWGDDMPDWVEALALECTRSSQNKVAARLDRSSALVSQVLRNKYKAELSSIEEVVRGVLLNATVECPSLGRLPSHQCQEWRAKGREFVAGNPLRLRMYRACLNCARNRKVAEVEA